MTGTMAPTQTRVIPPLYHYSNPGGLLGILQSQSIWLSNIHYQNDSDEYYHGLELIKNVIDSEYAGLPTLNIDFNRKKIYNVYTFSLTEEEDILSQWRGYCPSGGYAFAINIKQLQSTARYYLKLEPVVYGKVEKIDFIKRVILGFTPEEYHKREEYNNTNSRASWFRRDFYSPTKAAKMLSRDILSYAALLKHESFREEKEWRIITYDEYGAITMGFQEIPPISRGLETKFRYGFNTLIPYIQVPLTNDNQPIQLDKIVIGPTAHPELSEFSLQSMLKYSNPPVNIVKSSTPYRNW